MWRFLADVSSSLIFSVYSPSRANGTIRFPDVLSNLADHVNRVHLDLDRKTSTTSHPKRKKQRTKRLMNRFRGSRFRTHIPSAYSHNSTSSDHCHDCMWKMVNYLNRTMDRSVSRRHYRRTHRFLIYSNRLPNEFWSVNIARNCKRRKLFINRYNLGLVLRAWEEKVLRKNLEIATYRLLPSKSSNSTRSM